MPQHSARRRSSPHAPSVPCREGWAASAASLPPDIQAHGKCWKGPSAIAAISAAWPCASRMFCRPISRADHRRLSMPPRRGRWRWDRPTTKPRPARGAAHRQAAHGAGGGFGGYRQRAWDLGADNRHAVALYADAAVRSCLALPAAPSGHGWRRCRTRTACGSGIPPPASPCNGDGEIWRRGAGLKLFLRHRSGGLLRRGQNFPSPRSARRYRARAAGRILVRAGW